MRSLILAAVLTAFCASGTAAFAGGRADGTVASVNPVTGMLVLVDGRSLIFADRDLLRQLVPGEPIRVGYSNPGLGLSILQPCGCGGSVDGEPQD